MKTAFDHIAGEYDTYRPSYPQEVLERLESLLDSFRGEQHPAIRLDGDAIAMTVVDVGAGPSPTRPANARYPRLVAPVRRRMLDEHPRR